MPLSSSLCLGTERVTDPVLEKRSIMGMLVYSCPSYISFKINIINYLQNIKVWLIIIVNSISLSSNPRHQCECLMGLYFCRFLVLLCHIGVSISQILFQIFNNFRKFSIIFLFLYPVENAFPICIPFVNIFTIFTVFFYKEIEY